MTMISRKMLRRENGYEVWREISRPYFEAKIINDAGDPKGVQEIVDAIDDASDRLVTLEVAYTPRGSYIGNLETATFLVSKGIVPEALPSHNVCSIGFNKNEQKWYGWSHRAIFGFEIGAIAKEGDCVCSSGWTDEYLLEHPEEDLRLPVGFEAKTLEDAKRMAIAFAESVG